MKKDLHGSDLNPQTLSQKYSAEFDTRQMCTYANVRNVNSL